MRMTAYADMAGTSADLELNMRAMSEHLGALESERRVLETEKRELRRRLEDAERELAMTRLRVTALKGDLRRARSTVVPAGDEDAGYECPECCAGIAEPFEHRYCAGCGARFDWMDGGWDA